MKTPLLTRICFLALLFILGAVGCRQPDLLADIEGISSLQVEYSHSTALWELAWSPDGRSIAASTLGGGGGNDFSVVVIDLQTGEARELYDSGGPYNLLPEWSPDGQSPIFADPKESIPHIGGVVVVDAQSGQIARNLRCV